MDRFSEIFAALSDKTRLRVLYLLILSGEPLCVCELVDSLQEPQYNVSRQLRLLKNAGLVKENKKGRWKYYSLAKGKDPFMDHLLKTVSQIPKKNTLQDYANLKKRLRMRKGGECTVGVQNPCLSSRKKEDVDGWESR
jgi:ArsR family transcriptional regulator